MLDLNLDIVSSESSCNKWRQVNLENSGSTNSSIVNDDAEDVPSNGAGGGENSSTTINASSFIFDILKKETDDTITTTNNVKKVENPSPDFVTRQLFPVTGENGGLLLEFGTSLGTKPLANKPQWLNLSYAESRGEAAELKIVQLKPQPRKSRRGPRSRSSQYRGVTFYRRTGRWESHIWDCGKQVYLGGFDTAHAAAKAYDRAAIKFRGVNADINFSLSDYEEDIKQMKHMSKEQFVQLLRRQSNRFSRGSSKYRGENLHKCGRWEAQMEQILGKEVYDIAAMKCNGREAVTNFEPSTYEGKITNSGGGNCDNLDLSLGISAPSVAQNGSKNAVDLHFHHAASARERPIMFESSTSTSVSLQPQHCLAIASKHPPILSAAVYPALLPNNQERAMEKRAEAVYSTRFSNWVWQMQMQMQGFSGNIISPTPMFRIAASSGFSSSIATYTKNFKHDRNMIKTRFDTR